MIYRGCGKREIEEDLFLKKEKMDTKWKNKKDQDSHSPPALAHSCPAPKYPAICAPVQGRPPIYRCYIKGGRRERQRGVRNRNRDNATILVFVVTQGRCRFAASVVGGGGTRAQAAGPCAGWGARPACRDGSGTGRGVIMFDGRWAVHWNGQSGRRR